MQPDLRIRTALLADPPVLRELIDASVRRLQAQDYTPAQMEAALTSAMSCVSTPKTVGTYLVVEYCPAQLAAPRHCLRRLEQTQNSIRRGSMDRPARRASRP